MEWIIGIVTGLFSGFISGSLTCWYFYRRSGKELKQEAESLRQLNILIIRALEQAGLAKVSYDADGKPKGLVLELRANIRGVTISGTAASTVHRESQEHSKKLNDT